LLGVALVATAIALPLSRSNVPSRKPGKAGARTLGSVGPLATSDHECNHFGVLACPSSSAASELSTADCRLNDGSYVDLFKFSGVAGQTVTIDMTSTAFDTYLFLLDPTPVAVDGNDDFGGSTNSRIVFTLTATGTWTVGATSLEANQLGAYTLNLQCSGSPPAATTTPTPVVTPVPTATPIPGPCVPGPTTLCVNNGRFRVQMDWATPDGRTGSGTALPQTSDTGMFWFFSPNNVEAIVKVVNGCSFNQRYWVFGAGLTNVAVTLRVTDAQSGILRTYTNAQGNAFQPVQDTAAFATCP
jgi:Bacterial pre-peptidase C-terminal domain